jgi:hypothetical protein
MAFMIFNPRNSMMISRNDGKFNPNTENQRDTIINANTIMRLSRHRYTQEELNTIYNIPGRTGVNISPKTVDAQLQKAVTRLKEKINNYFRNRR